VKKKPTKPAAAAKETVGEPIDSLATAAPGSPLAVLSRELSDRLPNRLVRRFRMPSSVRECREIFLVEMTSRDEIQAGIFADAVMSIDEKRSVRLSAEAERREAIRLSIVAIGGRKVPYGSPVTSYEHVNHDGAPFSELSDWTMAAWTALQTWFTTMNGVPTEELAMGLLGAETVGAYAPPTSATRASAENGK
jgi:hypothetical protein